MYNEPQKVRIIEATFEPSTDTVLWVVELKNGDRYPMPWARKDSSKVLGINAEIPPLLLEEFNKKMLGKEINLIIKPPKDVAPPKPKKKRKKSK